MKGLLKILESFDGNSPMQELIRNLWREYPGLYNEKYSRDPEKWLRNIFSSLIDFGVAIGQSNLIEGNRSAAIGQGLNTKSFMELLIGTYAIIATSQDPASWVATDRLMALGNGPDADHRSLAYEVFKSGLLKLFNALVIGDFAHGESAGIPGAIRYHESKFQGFINAWLTIITDAATDGKQYARKDGQWVEVIDLDVKVAFDFITSDEMFFIYNCPNAMMFTSQESENDPATISPPLNTPLAKYQKVTITASETGLVILNGHIIV